MMDGFLTGRVPTLGQVPLAPGWAAAMGRHPGLGQPAKEEPPALSPVRRTPWYLRVGTPAMLGGVPIVAGPDMSRAASRGTRAVRHPYFGPGVIWPISPTDLEPPVSFPVQPWPLWTHEYALEGASPGGRPAVCAPPPGPRWGVYRGRYVRWPECDPRYDAQCPFPTGFIAAEWDPTELGRGAVPGGYPVANLGHSPTSHGTAARGRDLWYHPSAPCPPGFFRPSEGSPCVSPRSVEDWAEDYWVYGDRDRYVDARFQP